MVVYRIQSKQDRKRGAYHSLEGFENEPAVVKKLLKEHSDWDDPKHPPPEEDEGINRDVSFDEHCGFDSAVKLLQWFRGFIPDLLQAGYEIVALHDVIVTAVGKYQVLFRWDKNDNTKNS